MIKVVLIAALLAIGLLLLRARPSAGHLALKRLLAVGVLALGIVAVWFPLLTTRLANFLGVERGTDLVLYTFVVAFLFSTVSLYQRMYVLERRNADLTRALAIHTSLERSGSETEGTPASTSDGR